MSKNEVLFFLWEPFFLWETLTASLPSSSGVRNPDVYNLRNYPPANDLGGGQEKSGFI